MDIKTKTFIDKVKAKNHAKHKDSNGDWLYTYLKSLYVKGHDKIIITCKVHGDFLQTPSTHLQGSGCADCGHPSKRSTKEEFVIKAVEKHGKTYVYDKIDYKNNHTKISINCEIHGDFEQTPSMHLRGRGCPKCGETSRTAKRTKNIKVFITEANLIHKSIYFYTKTKYINTDTKVIITCNLHGDFEQTPDSHLRGQGCPDCGVISRVKKTRYTTSQFIAKAVLKHGNSYNYCKAKYTSISNNIIITCKIHRDFSQKPADHLQGSGCPVCAILKQGWTKAIFKTQCEKHSEGCGTLYVIRCFNGKETFYKIGRTSKTTALRYNTKISMPYNYEIIHEFIFDPDTVFNLEIDIKNSMGAFKYEPMIAFGGSKTECFSSIDYLESYFEYLSELQ